MKISSRVKNSAQMALVFSSPPTCGPTTSSCSTCAPASRLFSAASTRARTSIGTLLRIRRQADADVVRGAEVLHLRLVEAGRFELGAHRLDVGRVREGRLDIHAAR